MTTSLATTARQTYWRLASFVKSGAKADYPTDYSTAEIETIEAVRRKTLTTTERVVSLIRAVEYVTTHGVGGDIVECGVWKGGSMMAVALTLKRLRDTSRLLHLYDTFDGMPPPTDMDKDYRGNSAAGQLAVQDKDSSIWARAQLHEVQENMGSTGYPESRVAYIKGKVEDTIPGHIPESIAVLRLDTDWYESTKHELLHLFPRLVPGGVLILDDYGHWEGARRAVDEYIEASRHPLLLCRVDSTGRIAVKQR